MTATALKFRFSPHILEDLGVNLYTSISKALVEFVANAHDADAKSVTIGFDSAAIAAEKARLQEEFRCERRAASGQNVRPLAGRTLPPAVALEIFDDGHGMSVDDLQKKFLLIGRRRRAKQPDQRSPQGRLIMGRKGLGKLAGFGIAHTIEVITKRKEETAATKITLDLDALLDQTQSMGKVGEATEELNKTVPTERLEGWTEFSSGTRIVLKRLVYQAVRNDLHEILNSAMHENFYGISATDFAIRINNQEVDTSHAMLAFAYPADDGLGLHDLKRHTLETEMGDITFDYRIRFRPPKHQLKAKERGIRVYAHNRLAAIPDLLEIKSSTHGFQYTSYLDGIVVADFIDEMETDVISTDRQTLRWDTPVLSALKDFLSGEMSRALTLYAETISAEIERRIEEHTFTATTIQNGRLPRHRERTAWSLAKLLAGRDHGNLEAAFYTTTLPMVINGLGHGDILHTLHQLAADDSTSLGQIVREVTRLTRHEFDEFVIIVDARVKAIERLQTMVASADFKAANNEDELHELLALNPWLIDPTFFEFLTSDRSEETLARVIAQQLKVGRFVPREYDKHHEEETTPLKANKRPDLTFLLANESLRKLVIVELKAPNTPLHVDHLMQLEEYLERAEEIIRNKQYDLRVEGILIGSLDTASKASKVSALRRRMQKSLPPEVTVVDIAAVLQNAKNAHRELLRVYQANISALND